MSSISSGFGGNLTVPFLSNKKIFNFDIMYVLVIKECQIFILYSYVLIFDLYLCCLIHLCLFFKFLSYYVTVDSLLYLAGPAFVGGKFLPVL